MQGDDPPYLSVGTAVSAKYKGAFCEAKVSKVVRIVKCKVTYKAGLGSATVSDEQIKGTLRVGKLVQAKHIDRKEFVDATVTKIQDCSQYTVVFDDGDITTLRRTALCLKSGRHFNESETLDQLPLTHPEHFLNPVVGNRRGRRSRQFKEDSSDGELEEEKEPKLLQEVYSSDIGRVVSVEASDNKKKNKDNWFPGLVVIPSAQPTVRINVKDEFLVRSFKDGRYYTVPKKEVTDFSREQGARVESSALAEAVEKTLRYLDGDELPAHWERNALFYSPPKAEKSYHHHQEQREKLQQQQQQQLQQRQQSPSAYSGGDSSSRRGDRASSSRAGSRSEDSDDNFSDQSSDDEPREEKDHFVATLYKFLDDADTPMNRFPVIGNRDVDLYRLFRLVAQIGGYNRVTNQGKWRAIALRLKFSGTQAVCNQVKQVYKKFLLSYEGFYRTLGCTMRTHSRNNRFQRGGSRTLIRDRDRIATPVPSPKPVSTVQDITIAPASTATSHTNTTESESITTEDETTAAVAVAVTVVTPSPAGGKTKPTAPASTTSAAAAEKSGERSVTPAPGLNGSSRRVYPSSRKMSTSGSGVSAPVAALLDKKPEEDSGAVSNVRKKSKVVVEVSDSSDEDEDEDEDEQQQNPRNDGKTTATTATTAKSATKSILPQQNTVAKEIAGRPKRTMESNAIIKGKDRRSITPSTTPVTAGVAGKSATITTPTSTPAPALISKSTETVASADKNPTVGKVGKTVDSTASRGRSDGSSDRDVSTSTKLQRSTSTTSSGSGSGGNLSQTRSKSQQPVSSKVVEKSAGKLSTKVSSTLKITKINNDDDKIKDIDKDKKRGRKRLNTTEEREKIIESCSAASTVLTVEKSGNTGDGWTGPVSVGDILRVFYGPTHESKVTYEAKVLEIDKEGSSNNSGGSTGYHGPLYLVHYTGWNNRYDEYIQPYRIAENLSVTAKAKRLKNAAAAAGGGSASGYHTGRGYPGHHKSYSVVKPASSATAAAGKRGRGMSITGRSTLPDNSDIGGGNMTSMPARCTTPSSVTSTNSSNGRTKSPAGTTSTLPSSTATTPRGVAITTTTTTTPTTPTTSAGASTASSRPLRQPIASIEKDATTTTTTTTTLPSIPITSSPSSASSLLTGSGGATGNRRTRRTSLPTAAASQLQTVDISSDKSDSDEANVVEVKEEEDEVDQPVKKKKVIPVVVADATPEEDKKGRTRSGGGANKTPTSSDTSKVGAIGTRRRLIKTRNDKRKEDNDTEKEEEPAEKPKRSRKLRKLADIKPTVVLDSDDDDDDDEEEEDNEPEVRATSVQTPKGRDFDLNQIRSELKGLSSTTTKNVPVVNVEKTTTGTDAVKDESTVMSDESCGDKLEEKAVVKESDKKEDKSSSSEDIYEFKEPEPFDFEMKITDDKTKKRFAGRVFDDVVDKSPPKKKAKPIIEEKKTPFQQRYQKTPVKKEEPIEKDAPVVEKEKPLTLFDKLVGSPSFNTKPVDKLPDITKDTRKLPIEVDNVKLFSAIADELTDENDDSQGNSIFTKKEQQFLDGKFDEKLTDDMKTDDEDDFDKKNETDEDETFRNTIKQCIMREDSNDLIESFSLSKEDAKVYSFTVESEDGILEVKTEITDDKNKGMETKDFATSIKDGKLSENLFSKSDSKIDSDNRSDSMDIDQDCTASPVKVFETKPGYSITIKPSISSETTLPSIFSDILLKTDLADASLKSEIKPLIIPSPSIVANKSHLLDTSKLSTKPVNIVEIKDLKMELKKDLPVATSGGGKRGKKVLSQEFIDDTDSDSDSGERLVIARSDEELSQASDDITPIIKSLNKPDLYLSTDILATACESSADTDKPGLQPILPSLVTLGLITPSIHVPSKPPPPVKRNFNIEEITKGALASTLVNTICPITHSNLSCSSAIDNVNIPKVHVVGGMLKKKKEPDTESSLSNTSSTDKKKDDDEKIEEDEKDELNALLLCEETIPGSPAPPSEAPVCTTSASLNLTPAAAALNTRSKSPSLITNTPLLISNSGNTTLEMPFASAPSGSSTANLSNLASIASSNITSMQSGGGGKGIFVSGPSGITVRDDKDKQHDRLLLHHHHHHHRSGPELIGLAARMQQQHDGLDRVEDRGDREAASILVDNTPPTTPESTISNLSPRGENGDISPGHHHLSSPHSSPPLHPPSNLPPTSKRRTSSGGSTSSCASTTPTALSIQGSSPMGTKLGALSHAQGLYHHIQQHIEDMVVDGNERGGLNSGINLLASTSSSVARANVLPASPCKKRRRSNKSDHTPDRTPPTSGPPSAGLKRGRKPLRRPSPKVLPSIGILGAAMHHHVPPGNSDTEDGDDDDTTDSVHSGASAAGGGMGATVGITAVDRYSRSPRPPGKYNFVVEFDPSLDSGQRIAVLQQKLQDLRKAYASVKSELVTIERRRKKIRRKEREALKAAKQEMVCT